MIDQEAAYKRYLSSPQIAALNFIRKVDDLVREGSFSPNNFLVAEEILTRTNHILFGSQVIQKGINDETRSDNSGATRDWKDDNPPKDS